MNARVLGVAVVAGAVALAGCAKHDPESLRTSFAQQVASIGLVRDFQRNGDDLTFSAPDAAGGAAHWRIHIESVIIERNDDTTKPYKGTVASSWYMNGAPIQAATPGAQLPKGFTEKGLSQNSSALWEEATRQWHW